MTTELKGHTSMVLTIATTAGGQIVTGGNFGELCLWSLEGSLIKKHSFVGDYDIGSIVCSKRRPTLMYVASGIRIFTLDHSHLDQSLHTFIFNEEEINQLILDEREEYLAACDDSGDIKVINLFNRRVHKTLRKHTNICATVTFHPKRPWELFSGGYDSSMVQWDYNRGRALCVVEMEHVGVQRVESSDYMINPPFVHSIATDTKGQYLACATESATVQLFLIHKRKPEHFITLRGHSLGVSMVCFPHERPGHMISGGNDGQVFVWDLEKLCTEPISNGKSGTSEDEATTSSEQVTQGINQPIATISHGSNINWLITHRRNNQVLIIVADNLDKVTIYPYPQI